jgi:hypothetical protein
MARPTVLIGRLALREDDFVSESTDSSGGRTFSLAGQESIPRLSASAVAKRREDILAISGQFIPVVFTTKTYLNGFYKVDSSSGSIEDWKDDMRIFPWNIALTRVGTKSDIDIESRLSGSLTRANNFAITGVRLHAPAINHVGYWTDATVTSAVTRATQDGNIKCYLGIGETVSPRWAIDPIDYGKGRVRFLDDEDIERAGSSVNPNPMDWELSNGLVRIRPLSSGGVLEISAWSGTAWLTKAWDLRAGGVALPTFTHCTILYNEFEAVTIRLMSPLAAGGRVYVDITLRRGFRIAEIYIQSEVGTTLKVVRATTEAGTAGAGYITATANDGDANKYIIGSAKTYTADTVNGGIEKAATATLDAYIGVVFGGTGAVAGDLAADLQKQYIGAPSELVQGVRR